MSLVLGEKFIAERLICGRIGKYLERPIIADAVVQPPLRTQSYASGRTLICLNTCGLLNALRLNERSPQGAERVLFPLASLRFASGACTAHALQYFP